MEDKVEISKCSGVYQILSKATGQAYVGSTTKTFSARWAQWVYHLGRGTGNPHLRRAWAKYGQESFEFSVLEVVERVEDVLVREQHYIDTLRPYYNINPKAESRLGSKASDETKAKMSQTRQGKPIHTERSKATIGDKNRGRAKSEGAIQAHSQALTGHKHSDEAKAKMSLAQRARYARGSSPLKGSTHSEETKAKIRESVHASPACVRSRQQKDELKRLARSGQPRPSCSTTTLGRALVSYTCQGARAYDEGFDTEIRSIRPSWFKESMNNEIELDERDALEVFPGVIALVLVQSEEAD